MESLAVRLEEEHEQLLKEKVFHYLLSVMSYGILLIYTKILFILRESLVNAESFSI